LINNLSLRLFMKKILKDPFQVCIILSAMDSIVNKAKLNRVFIKNFISLF
jgi:hypothetical protein